MISPPADRPCAETAEQQKDRQTAKKNQTETFMEIIITCWGLQHCVLKGKSRQPSA